MRVLLVADVKGWCWWHMAKGIQKYSSHDCDVTTSTGLSKKSKNDIVKYDIVFQFGFAESRQGFPIKSSSMLDHPGWMHNRGNGYIEQRSTTKLRNRLRLKMLPRFDSILVKNNELFEFLSGVCNVKRVKCGFDKGVFCRRKKNQNEKLVIGWCGQHSILNQKGYDEILVPIMNSVKRDVVWEINDREHRTAITQSEMSDWYASLDLLLCTSCGEGGPMPPLEALACNRNVLSTRVGFLEELPSIEFVDTKWNSKESEALVVAEFVEKIESFVPFEVESMHDWSWEVLADSWIEAM